MREVTFKLPPVAERVAISEAWAAARGYETDESYDVSTQHDWIHAAFDLDVNCEAIVCQMEEGIECGILQSWEGFLTDCNEGRWADDTFTEVEVLRGWQALERLAA